MKVKKAEGLCFFLCENCAAVHIGFWRGGKMFAEAIPDDIDGVAVALNKAIAESRELIAVKAKH